MTHPTCSSASLAAGEDLLGTGTSATLHWVALEVRGSWRPKALFDNDLPESVSAWLRGLKQRPDAKPLFIKRRGKRDGVTVLYANVTAGRVHRFELADASEAPALPWEALFAGTTDAGRTDERPILVCTHSTRDHCCGLHGAGVARALEDAAPGRVWQCTHLGGHRFAATVVALPDGVHYGRVRMEDAAALVSELDAGRIHDLHQLRGLVRYPAAVQAAVDTVRRERDLRDLDAVTGEVLVEDGDAVHVRVHTPTDDVDLHVTRTPGDTAFPASCGADESVPMTWVITR